MSTDNLYPYFLMPTEKVTTIEHKASLALIGVTLISFIAVFWTFISKMTLRWADGDNSYAYLIVPLFLYLCWGKKQQFRYDIFTWNGWGVLAGVCSIGCIFLGELGSVETLIFFGLWGCLASMILTIYGYRSRELLFPLLVLLFIIPLPPFINELITFKFKLLVSRISAEILRFFGISVLLEGNILDLGVSRLEVVDACSGLRYLMSLVLLALFMGHYFARDWWKRILLILLVFPLLVLLNGARIFMTGILTVNGHAELTHGAFHDIAGIIFFLIAGGIFYLISKTIGTSKPVAVPGALSLGTGAPIIRPADKKNAFTPMVFLCLLFISSGIFLHSMPKISTSPQREKFESFPLSLGQWQGRTQVLSDEILDQLWADDYLNATYKNNETQNVMYLLIPFYEYQGTRHTAHAPQSCLLGGGFAIEKSQERAINLPDGKSITVMTMEMLKNDEKLLASYFFMERGRVITNPWLNKYYLVIDAVTKKRTDGALVRVEMTIPHNQNVVEAYRLQDDFIARIYPLLKKYIPE